VQGVGFRYTVTRHAAHFPIAGTVRNLASGAVEIDVEGDDEAVDGFIEAVLRNPPPGARVDRVDRREENRRGITGFTLERNQR
jgi:acylphosphatase